MSEPELPDRNSPRRVHLPLWLCAVLAGLVVTIIYPLLVIGLPWVISLWTPRVGWGDGRPANWNLVGLVPVTVGLAGLVWVFGTMFAQMPKLPDGIYLEEDERLWRATGRILLAHGPFAFSRNPMFLSGLTVWFGWALFYGSPVVLAATIAIWALTNYLTIPSEEQALAARFGSDYEDYRKHVRRWFGWSRRG
jgi:protein-S-isoprenylcysteine O-methyltransferase Ste14